MKRGDVVIVEIPYVEVVQNDHDNRRLANTVVAMISGNIEHADEPTQLLVDPATAAGASAGLHGPSVIKCCNLFTVAQADIQRVIGRLSEGMLAKLDDCLRAALSLR